MISSIERAGGWGRVAYALLAVLFIYMVLLGGSALGEGFTILRLANALIGGVFIVLALAIPRESFDRTDRLVVWSLIPFALAGVLSSFPRQSLDAVMAATAFVAAFMTGRRFLQTSDGRRLFVATLQCLSVGLTMLTFARWVVPTLAWWAGTGWSITPPLNFELVAFPWGHRHDLALLVVMLYPAWWTGYASPLRRALRIAMGALAVPIVLVDGSRAVWIAVGVASLVVGARAVGWSRLRLHWRWARVAIALVLVVALVTGVGGALLSRALNPATLSFRTAMWGAIFDDWQAHPVAGHGPGSFAWVLQLTGYFDTNSWAPRHPDNAAMQMLAEGGVLGLAAMTLVVAAILPAVLRSESRAACWALVAFGIAALGGNPTDFAFMVTLAVGWAAYALPRETSWEHMRVVWAQPTRAASLLCVGIIAVACASVTVASLHYDRARDAIANGALSEAIAELDAAVALDPGLALYARQRGAAEHLRGNDDRAVADLESAVYLNGSDDLAWRTLALTSSAAGEAARADSALARALSLQRSDPTNLLLSATMDPPSAEVATDVLAEAVQAWPTLLFAPGWTSVLPSGTSTDSAIGAALQRWLSGAAVPESISDQLLWLAAMADRDDLIPAAIAESGWSETLGTALVAAIQCRATNTQLDSIDLSDRRTYLYWWLRFRDAELRGEDGAFAHVMVERMGHPIPAGGDRLINPLDENGANSTDAWGYRRWPITWIPSGAELPSPNAGLARWMMEPQCAA